MMPSHHQGGASTILRRTSTKRTKLNVVRPTPTMRTAHRARPPRICRVVAGTDRIFAP
jgi:hypothetical protein